MKDKSDYDEFRKLIIDIKKAGVISEPKSGGIHFHVDFGEPYVGEMATLMSVFSEIEIELKKTFGTKDFRSRFTQSKSEELINYLKNSEIPINEDRFDRLHDFIIKQDRNHGLNMNSFFKVNTVEFRIFNSTLDLNALELMTDFSKKLVKAVRTKDPAFMNYLINSKDPIQLDQIAKILGMKLAHPIAQNILNRIMHEGEKKFDSKIHGKNNNNLNLYSHLVVLIGTAAVIDQWLTSAASVLNFESTK